MTYTNWQRHTHTHGAGTCRALWFVSMPCFLRQSRLRGSGALPMFQSDVAPESITHCNTHTHRMELVLRSCPTYLTRHVMHGHAVLLHAGCTSIVRRVPDLIGGGGSAVYPPLHTQTYSRRQSTKNWQQCPDMTIITHHITSYNSFQKDVRNLKWSSFLSLSYAHTHYELILLILCRNFQWNVLPLPPTRV